MNCLREIKDPKHLLNYLLSPVKVSYTQMIFCGLHTHISFHLAELLAVNVILYHTVF